MSRDLHRQNLKMTHHINMKFKAAMANFVKILSVRKYLTKQACKTLVLSLVLSHLDYSNSALVGIPDTLINKFQRIQNMCTKLVLNRSKHTSSTDALKQLHWLPIRLRIMFKIQCIVHKCLYGKASHYLKFLLTIKCNARLLRSSQDTTQLVKPWMKLKTFVDRSCKGTRILEHATSRY